MEKNKKVIFAVLAVGVVIIVMLGALLIQGHNNSPEVQAQKASSSSIASSISAKSSASSSESAESSSIAKSAKKFDSVKGPVILGSDGIAYKTTWSQAEFDDYVKENEFIIDGHADGSLSNNDPVPVSNLGTSKTFSTFDELADVASSRNYYDSASDAYTASVKAQNHSSSIKILKTVQ
ncbi:hypothetical protein [Weissella oryzae]|nr:hypothetical protein [Weissella oryzae]